MDVFGIFISPFVEAMVDNLSSYLINLVSKEDVDTGIQNLKKTFDDLKTLLADAENKQLYDKDIKKWLEEVQHLAYDADDILDDFTTEALESKLKAKETLKRELAKFLSLFPFNSKNGSKPNEITSQLQEVATKGKELGLLQKPAGNMSANVCSRSPTTCLEEPRIYGRDEDIKEIRDLLLGDAPAGKKFDVIPIVGLGGIGKTSLARHIYNLNEVKNHFILRAWVCVSDDFEVTRITKAILESFTHDSCSLGNLNEIQVKLKGTLAEKKFLLVLDDVWGYGYDGWNSLQLPFGAGAPGSKIIVTTRDRGVATQMAIDKYHNLQSLSYDDCWLIFAHHAFENRNIEDYQELESIGKKIVNNKCGGLPLAARALGSLLRCKQEKREWEEILNNNIWNEESAILPALKLSYLHLPVHLKRCFSYCAIFPKDYEFGEEELILLWMAEGLIEQPNGGEQMEDLGRKYFHELVSRSFFQSSSGNTPQFIMHDLINDLAQEVAGDKCFRLEHILKGDRQNKILEKARHFSYVASSGNGIQKIKVLDDAKCLRTVLDFSPPSPSPMMWTVSLRCNLQQNFIKGLLPNLKCLREFRFCGYGIRELPDSIGDLKHLRYLDLSNSEITKLPDSVVTLYNLQVLLLKFCLRLKKLPLNMESLVNLRHFDMTGVKDFPPAEEMPLQIGKLENLQTLSNFMVGKDCGRKIGELKKLSHIRGALHISRLENVSGVEDARDANLISKEELKELSLHWGYSHSPQNDLADKDVLDMLRPYALLERLTISGHGSTKFPNWVGDASFSKMVSMRLEHCKCCTSLPPLGQLPSLKDLYIEGMSSVKRLGCEFYGQQCDAKPFPSLERLCFVDMPEWEDWSTFGIQPFYRLNELSIQWCPKLVGRLPNDLPCLKSFKIDHCSHLLVDVSSPILASLTSLSTRNVTLKLGSLTLHIRHVTVLDSLCDPNVADDVLLVNAISKHPTSITTLKITVVEKLEFLPTRFPQELMGLETLNISWCSDLVTLWQNEVGLKHHLPSLLHLHISSCPKLVCLFKEEQHEGLPCMKRLENLTIINCEMLKKLPQDLHTYTSLGELSISGCESLISFPMKGLPFMLRKLWVGKCGALRFLPELMTLNNLQELSVSYCKSLTYLSRGGLPSTLKQLTIERCDNLESLLAEEGIKIDCPSLETINIVGCSSLKSLPDNANNFRNLVKLTIRECNNLESLPEGWFHGTTNLREFEIDSCEKLEILEAHDENHNISQLTSLQRLKFRDCHAGIVSYFLKGGSFPNLSSLKIVNIRADVGGQLPPPSSEWGLHKLFSLKTLVLEGLTLPSEDTVFFPEDGMLLPTSLIELTITNFPNLERFSHKEFLNLTSLETLSIQGCPRFTSFPKEGLPRSLLYLHIDHCPEFTSFPEQGFPSSLMSLRIYRCNPILNQLCRKGEGPYWHMIECIPDVNIYSGRHFY